MGKRLSATSKQLTPATRKPRAVGRPSTYSESVAAAICDRIANGEMLTDICKRKGMPRPSTIFAWLKKFPAFAEIYACAQDFRLRVIAEQILAIADDSSRDYATTRKGRVLDKEAVMRSRLRVDAREWLLARLASKQYGDRINADLTSDGKPIQGNYSLTELMAVFHQVTVPASTPETEPEGHDD